jgi:hypothetical protein
MAFEERPWTRRASDTPTLHRFVHCWSWSQLHENLEADEPVPRTLQLLAPGFAAEAATARPSDEWPVLRAALVLDIGDTQWRHTPTKWRSGIVSEVLFGDRRPVVAEHAAFDSELDAWNAQHLKQPARAVIIQIQANTYPASAVKGER